MTKWIKAFPTVLSIKLIHLYRAILSPLIGNQCRFHPTCSHYAEDSFKKHGFFKGFLLTLFRVFSCHPYSRRAWTDPVPERFAWKALLGYKQDTSTKEHSTTDNGKG